MIEHIDSRPRAQRSIGILEGYEKFDLSVVLKVHAPFGAGVFDFVFLAVPQRRFVELNAAGHALCSPCNFNSGARASHKHYEAVFTGVTKVVEDVEKIIPYIVRIESPKDRLDFRRRIFGPSLNSVFNLGEFGTREVSAPGGVHSPCRVEGVVKTGAQMLDNLSNEEAPFDSEVVRKLNLMDGVNAIRVQLSHSYQLVFSKKLLDLGYKVLEMKLCSLQA
jgi:hypothetical protein